MTRWKAMIELGDDEALPDGDWRHTRSIELAYDLETLGVRLVARVYERTLRIAEFVGHHDSMSSRVPERYDEKFNYWFGAEWEEMMWRCYEDRISKAACFALIRATLHGTDTALAADALERLGGEWRQVVEVVAAIELADRGGIRVTGHHDGFQPTHWEEHHEAGSLVNRDDYWNKAAFERDPTFEDRRARVQ